MVKLKKLHSQSIMKFWGQKRSNFVIGTEGSFTDFLEQWCFRQNLQDFLMIILDERYRYFYCSDDSLLENNVHPSF